MEMEVLLTPLAAHAPCGDDLSFSSEFDTINEMRRADDATLNQGEWVTSLKVADWPGVARWMLIGAVQTVRRWNNRSFPRSLPASGLTP